MRISSIAPGDVILATRICNRVADRYVVVRLAAEPHPLPDATHFWCRRAAAPAGVKAELMGFQNSAIERCRRGEADLVVLAP